MKKGSQHKVSTPLAIRARMLRRTILPLAVWIIAVSVAFYLARYEGGGITAVGSLEPGNVNVAPVVDGVVESIPVDLFDEVQRGQTIALMDDSLLKSELLVADAELSRLRAELVATKNRLEQESETARIDRLNELRRFQVDSELARLDYLDRIVVQETEKINLQRLETLIQMQENLVEDNILDKMTLKDTRLQYQALKTRLEENREAIKLAQNMQKQRLQRMETRNDLEIDFNQDDLLSPFTEAVNVQAALIAQLKQQRASLVITSPIEGKVSQFYHRPGETVLAGDPILSITDEKGTRVVAYVEQTAVDKISEGGKVEVTSSGRQGTRLVAEVQKISPGIVQLPQHLWRNPAVPEWGMPVLVGSIPQGSFIPGETLNVRFLTATQ